ncbi:MAG: glycosyltransferase family 39 protein, partial [Candidatus Omnitrophota bacterium]|nr:glycosyltransferase family 39 protein [Candidatus Omnitrophota bacterium]
MTNQPNQSPPASFFKLNRAFIIFIALIAILWIASVIRLQWINYAQMMNYSISYDGIRYDWIAGNLLTNQGFGYSPNEPSSWRPPGYPFFLYAVYSLFGHSIYAARIVQGFLGTATCLLLYLLTKKLSQNIRHNEMIALLAAFLYAINYHSIFFTEMLLTELFNSTLTLLAVYLFYLADESKQRKFPIVSFFASLILWYSVLTRPADILFWLWVGIWFLLKNRSNSKKIYQALFAVLLGFCLTVLPWTIRNYALHQKVFLISTNGGFIFFMAHHPHSQGGFIPEGPTRYTPQQEKELSQLNEIGRQRKHYAYGFNWILNHPKEELTLLLIKQKRLWT